MSDTPPDDELSEISQCRVGRGFKHKMYREDDVFIDDEPLFLKQIPDWHKNIFPEKKVIYDPEAERILGQTFIAINQVTRIMSIRNLCLLIFPFPRVAGRRQDLKNVIYSAIRLNGLKLSEGLSSIDKDRGAKWFHCLNGYVELERLEDAAQRGWLLHCGGYIPIWRKYVDEKEAYHAEKYSHYQIDNHIDGPSKPSSRTDLQIEKISIVKAKSPKLTIREIHDLCQQKWPELFTMTLASFKKNTMKAWRNR